MTVMAGSGSGPSGGRGDQDDALSNEFVSYWSDDRFVVQNGRGELVASSDVTMEVNR